MKELKRRRSKRLSLLTAVTEDMANSDSNKTENPSVANTDQVESHHQLVFNDTVNEESGRGNRGTSSRRRSSLEASLGQDVAHETFGDSWMHHSYSSLSEYLASR